ncbi:LCP family protein [Streptomyces monashensis]|uniref:Transcriptional regulator n=1 Tax=Streptomyces monashensis TaxID=1678012 RepID=A0A1S2PE61_9ACTN|nr:transcriptional regulator [Streptomyces monashensis]
MTRTDGGSRMTTTRDGSTARVRKRSPWRIMLLIALVVVMIGAVGLGWIYLTLNSSIHTFDAGGLSRHRPTAGPSQSENVLVIGSDARNDGNSSLGGGDANDIGRSDTAFLLHVYADHQHALAVSIPRDTLVTIPPCKLPDGSWTKTQTNAVFNSAFSVGQTDKGNPACTQNTVEQLTGLRVDHTVVVDFKGFAALTGVVGGVRVCLPQDVYEKDLDPNRATRGNLLFKKGEQTVSGQQALDYVRIRHGLGDGSDIGRIKRQQAFLSSLIKKVKSDGITPANLLPLADAATKSLTVDPGLGTANKLISFAMSLRDIDLHNTKFVTLPWQYAGERVAVVEPDASSLWAALKADRTIDGTDASGRTQPHGDTSASPNPTWSVSGAGINVAVYNGTTLSSLTSKAVSALTEHGFTVTGTATASSQDDTTTVIEYGASLRSQAEKVAQLFPGAQLRFIGGSGVNAVLGASYATGGSSTPTTPTAVPGSVRNDARSADDDPCSDLTYGSGG